MPSNQATFVANLTLRLRSPRASLSIIVYSALGGALKDEFEDLI